MVAIEPEDDYFNIAYKIYNSFEVNQSTSVRGFIRDDAKKTLHEKGQLVLDLIKGFDESDNVQRYGRKTIRRRVIPPNSIGGCLAHKIFKWDRVIDNDEPKFRIWRTQ